MLFRVINGKHNVRDSKGGWITVKKGQTIESNTDLTKIFRNRFQRLDVEVPTVADVSVFPPPEEVPVNDAVTIGTSSMELADRGDDITEMFAIDDMTIKIYKSGRVYSVWDTTTDIQISRILRSKKAVSGWLKEHLGE